MLEILLNASLLFAQRTSGRQLRLAPADSSVSLLIGLGLLALVVMGLVVAIIQYRQRRQASGVHHSPSELWAELCRVHRLEKPDVLALRELAEVRQLEPAASLFVRADLWQLEQDTVEIRHLQPQLQRLQGVLFAGSEPQPKLVRI